MENIKVTNEAQIQSYILQNYQKDTEIQNMTTTINDKDNKRIELEKKISNIKLNLGNIKNE